VKGREIIARECGQGAAHRRGDGVKNAQKRIGMRVDFSPKNLICPINCVII
jgi:hypothetical protein